jgi:hypothetical protein
MGAQLQGRGMSARFIVFSATRIERSKARLAVLAMSHETPADDDIDIVINAPLPLDEIHVFDRVWIKKALHE